MKVVYFAEIFPSDSETWIHHEITSLQSLGCDVHVFATHPRPTLVSWELEKFFGITTYLPEIDKIPFSGRSFIAAHRLIPVLRGLISDCMTLRDRAQVVRDLMYIFRFASTLEVVCPDIVIAHFGGTRANLALFYALATGTPFVLKMHASDVFRRVALLRLKVEMAERVLTISHYNIRFIEQHYSDVDISRFRKHACGIPLDEYLFKPQEKAPLRPIITTVGRLVPMKGYDILIRATRILVSRGLNFGVVIIGDGPEREHISGLIRELSLQGIVDLRGYCSPREVQQTLLKSSLFVLPAIWDPIAGTQDGIPVALMEAMAIGLPVISTKTSGIPELVVDGVTGFLAEPNDAESLATQMADCLEMGREEIGVILKAAREKVEQNHDIRKLTIELLQLLKFGIERR